MLYHHLLILLGKNDTKQNHVVYNMYNFNLLSILSTYYKITSSEKF